jgi:hypothetical protein
MSATGAITSHFGILGPINTINSQGVTVSVLAMSISNSSSASSAHEQEPGGLDFVSDYATLVRKVMTMLGKREQGDFDAKVLKDLTTSLIMSMSFLNAQPLDSESDRKAYNERFHGLLAQNEPKVSPAIDRSNSIVSYAAKQVLWSLSIACLWSKPEVKPPKGNTKLML